MNSPLANNCYYHIYNRGVEKRSIFKSFQDCQRFLNTINFYRLYPTPRKLSTHLSFDSPPLPAHIKQKELVRILCFCLMDNHFHLLIQQSEERGVSEFMRRVSDSYTRYFNTKYSRVGALFQGKFKAKIIESDEYLLQLSKYIHRNPLTLPMWKGQLSNYQFSSYSYYLNNKKIAHNLCCTDLLANYYKSSNDKLSYQSFVEDSSEINLPETLLIESVDTSDV